MTSIPPLAQGVRTTLLASSLEMLRQRGHYDRYCEIRGAEAVADVSSAAMVTGWAPMDTAMGHYQACDALHLPDEEVMQMGDVVGARMSNTVMGSLVRMARSGGITPWVMLRKLDGLWARIYQGSVTQMRETGPKDASVTIDRMPLASVPYWRIALTGLLRGVVQTFASKAYAHHVHSADDVYCVTYKLSWV